MNHARHSNRGNALFMIMIAIFLIGLLAKTVVDKNLDVTNFADSATDTATASAIVAHAVNLKTAVNNMVNQGTDPSSIDDMSPLDGAFSTAPHMAKLYHPYGGGAAYFEDYSGWNNILIHKEAVIQDIGPSSDPEILAIGDVSSGLCQALAQNNSPTTATQAAINALRGGTAVTLSDSSTCSSGTCDAVASTCLQNPGATQHVFYFLLRAR